MKRTALALLGDDLKLTPSEYALIRAMLAGNPVAVAGHEAMLPRADLVAALSGGGIKPPVTARWSSETLEREIHKLFRTTRHLGDMFRDDVTRGFQVVDTVAWDRQSTFIRYKFSAVFLELLRAVAAQRELDSLF